MKITNVLPPKASRTMKRIILLSILVIYGVIIFSPRAYSQGLNIVNVEKAKAVAKSYCLNTEAKYARVSENDLVLSLAETKTVDSSVIYYVFNINKEHGFIIVSANQNSPPVLCYVPKGSFDSDPEKRPPAFNDWLEAFTAQIEFTIKNAVKNTKEQDIWNAYISKRAWDIDSMVLKLTSTWDQGAYYNTLCPSTEGHPASGPDGHCPTGCVATAMGQIMYYYEWPSTGDGIHSYDDPSNTMPPHTCTDPTYGNLSFHEHNSYYNYGAMENHLNSYNYEVAKLLYNCGVSVSMDYKYCGSWTNTSDVPQAIDEHFNYNSARYISGEDYNYSKWVAELKDQIRKERPIQYRGQNQAGAAHSWICYGYKTISEKTYFTFNFGWGGDFDGDYLLGEIPEGFVWGHGAVIDIFPPNQPDLQITSGSVSPNPVVTGVPFILNFTVLNDGSRDAKASTAAFYLSSDQKLDKNDTCLDSLDIDPLTYGRTAVVNSESITIDEGLPEIFYILVEADTDHDVHESDETDNVFSICTKPGLWTGGRGNWEVAGNWCGGVVPTGDVIIPAGAEVHVTSAPAAPAVCNNLTIFEEGIMIIDAGKALTVNGILINNGELNLNSDDNGIASLMILNSYTGDGTANIDLFLTGGGAPAEEGDPEEYKWHYIASPVQNINISVFNGNTLNLAKYDESLVTESQDQGWVAATDGYYYYNTEPTYYTNKIFSTLDLGKGYAYYWGSDQTYTISGNINTSAVGPVSLAYNSAGTIPVPGNVVGFNLIGNPFTCTLDWEKVADYNYARDPKPNISYAIYSTQDYTKFPAYVYDPVTKTGTYSDGGSKDIPPMQAFFVDALAGSQSIILPVTAKAHSDQIRFKGNSEHAVPLVRLLLEDGENQRDAVVSFNEKAELSFDNRFDAYKLSKSLGPINVWTKLIDIDFAINSIPIPETSIEIPVGIHIAKAGSFKLSSNELKGLYNYSVMLKDKATNFTVNLKTGNSLTFSTQAGDFEDRFVLTISNLVPDKQKTPIFENNFNIYALHGILNINPLSDDWNGKSGSVRIADLMGKSIIDYRNVEFWKNSLIQLPLSRAKGIYLVEIRSGMMTYVGKVIIN